MPRLRNIHLLYVCTGVVRICLVKIYTIVEYNKTVLTCVVLDNDSKTEWF